ncbi:MAG TPA: hypothetical protein VHF65_04840 [Nitrososphaera sp.]|nr:hypothetical protein [Nitrososphaera sp.]
MFFLCRLSFFIDHGKLKVRGRKKKKKYIPKNGRINIATIAAADATSRISGKRFVMLLLLLPRLSSY